MKSTLHFPVDQSATQKSFELKEYKILISCEYKTYLKSLIESQTIECEYFIF